MGKIKARIRYCLESEKGRDVLTVLIVILVGIGSFELGRLSKGDSSSGIRIEYPETEALGGNVISATFTEDPVPIITPENKSFFASKRGKSITQLAVLLARILSKKIEFGLIQEKRQKGLGTNSRALVIKFILNRHLDYMKKYVLITSFFFLLAFIAGIMTSESEAEAYYSYGKYGYYSAPYRDNYGTNITFGEPERYYNYGSRTEYGTNFIFNPYAFHSVNYDYYAYNRPAGIYIAVDVPEPTDREEPSRRSGDNIVFGTNAQDIQEPPRRRAGDNIVFGTDSVRYVDDTVEYRPTGVNYTF